MVFHPLYAAFRKQKIGPRQIFEGPWCRCSILEASVAWHCHCVTGWNFWKFCWSLVGGEDNWVIYVNDTPLLSLSHFIYIYIFFFVYRYLYMFAYIRTSRFSYVYLYLIDIHIYIGIWLTPPASDPNEHLKGSKKLNRFLVKLVRDLTRPICPQEVV